ncbi:MAG: transglutaminase-like domain-containing protein [Alphaproteobacteria bacterium]
MTDVPADVADALDPSPFIESDDPAIVGLARSVAGGETDAAVAARRLLKWVNDHMTQAPSLTVPSAREALRERRGDCNEHAVLLAALGRAAGIPSRVAAGAMYADGAFLYHAWTEFWLGSWVTADAVFRQMPVDATHVKLVEGGPEHHGELARIVGRLEFAPAQEKR